MSHLRGRKSNELIRELRGQVRYLKNCIHLNNERESYRKKGVTKKYREIIREVKSEYSELESAVAHIVKDESWDSASSKQLHLEIIIRTIVSYRKLVDGGIVVFSEFAFLLTGSQFEYFSVADIVKRFGKYTRWKRDLRLCIEAGYIKRIERKQLFYITLDGRSRFDAILGHIYREKGLGHPLRNIANESTT